MILGQIILDTLFATRNVLTDEENVKTEKTHLNSVEEIKMKAMKEVVNPLKHLTGIDNRKSVTKKKQEERKGVACNGKQLERCDSDKKRQPSPNGNKSKKIKINDDETDVKSEDEADIELHISYSDCESSGNDNIKENPVVKSLPVLINNAGEYEIELINESESNETTSKPNKTVVKTLSVPLKRVKKEKTRTLKKRQLRSRLSRLGTLKVASLDK